MIYKYLKGTENLQYGDIIQVWGTTYFPRLINAHEVRDQKYLDKGKTTNKFWATTLAIFTAIKCIKKTGKEGRYPFHTGMFLGKDENGIDVILEQQAVIKESDLRKYDDQRTIAWYRPLPNMTEEQMKKLKAAVSRAKLTSLEKQFYAWKDIWNIRLSITKHQKQINSPSNYCTELIGKLYYYTLQVVIGIKIFWQNTPKDVHVYFENSPALEWGYLYRRKE